MSGRGRGANDKQPHGCATLEVSCVPSHEAHVMVRRLPLLRTPRLPPNPSTPPSHYKTPSAGAEVTPLHSYQMQMPAGASPLVNSPFGAEAGPAVVLTTQALLSTINTPVFSAVTPSPEKQVNRRGGIWDWIRLSRYFVLVHKAELCTLYIVILVL